MLEEVAPAKKKRRTGGEKIFPFPKSYASIRPMTSTSTGVAALVSPKAGRPAEAEPFTRLVTGDDDDNLSQPAFRE